MNMTIWRGKYTIYANGTEYGDEVHVEVLAPSTDEEVKKALMAAISDDWGLDGEEDQWTLNQESLDWEIENGNGGTMVLDDYYEIRPITVFTKDPTTTVAHLPELRYPLKYPVQIETGRLSLAVDSALNNIVYGLPCTIRQVLSEGFCLIRCVPTWESLYAVGASHVKLPGIGPKTRKTVLHELFKQYNTEHPGSDHHNAMLNLGKSMWKWS
jgi:hypothetical protein